MATYISLVNWTDQGIRSLKDSPGRVDGARKLAKKYGCEMGDFFMTIGPYDMVVMIEAPDGLIIIDTGDSEQEARERGIAYELGYAIRVLHALLLHRPRRARGPRRDNLTKIVY